ncbi:hypothetical protein [Actinopolyspora halophila]|uniref:hypothetical protein n=1 Tax=Actinopolyspora halophila TaxID=1850 RepID=UPI00036194C9|nr:hypothetical protein [Actinopolyspora halophila]
MSETGQTFNFHASSFVGAQNFASGGSANVERAVGSEAGSQGELDELRRLVTELTTQLAERSDTDAVRAHDQATELEELLREEQPDGDSVRKRWSKLRPLLDTLGHAGSVASIAGLLGGLF